MTNPLAAKLGRFSTLSPEDLDQLSQLSSLRQRRYRAREEMVREGERPDRIHLILEGWAYRYKVLEDGRKQIIGFLLPGDICDPSNFVLSETDHSISAITPVLAAGLQRGDMEELGASNNKLQDALAWERLVAAAIQRETAVNLGLRDAFERLAHLFCELFARLELVALTDGRSCEMPLTQMELGEALGMSAVHVNRTLQELRAAKLIVLRDRTLTVLDRPGLEAAASFSPRYLHLGQLPRST